MMMQMKIHCSKTIQGRVGHAHVGVRGRHASSPGMQQQLGFKGEGHSIFCMLTRAAGITKPCSAENCLYIMHVHDSSGQCDRRCQKTTHSSRQGGRPCWNISWAQKMGTAAYLVCTARSSEAAHQHGMDHQQIGRAVQMCFNQVCMCRCLRMAHLSSPGEHTF